MRAGLQQCAPIEFQAGIVDFEPDALLIGQAQSGEAQAAGEWAGDALDLQPRDEARRQPGRQAQPGIGGQKAPGQDGQECQEEQAAAHQ